MLLIALQAPPAKHKGLLVGLYDHLNVMRRKSMSRKFFPLLVLTITAVLILTLISQGRGAHMRNAVLIGWDGAQRDHMKECLSRGELPNVAVLIKEGGIADIDISEKTDTKAGWAQILTGYSARITGVYSNSKYGAIPRGYTIFERLENYFGAGNFATLAVISKLGNVGSDSPGKQSNKKKKADGNPEPYYYTKDNMDLFKNGLGENQSVGKKTLEVLDQYRNKPFFLFVHFGDVDHQGHIYGENSKEYNEALISCDYWTGRIMEKLKELKLYDSTRIYVTADHGFDEGEKRHRSANQVFLVSNDKSVIHSGKREDITPTILDRFGVDLSGIQPPLTGKSLSTEK